MIREYSCESCGSNEWKLEKSVGIDCDGTTKIDYYAKCMHCDEEVILD